MLNTDQIINASVCEGFRYSGHSFECSDRDVRIAGRTVGTYRIHANLTRGAFVPCAGATLTDGERDAIYRAIDALE